MPIHRAWPLFKSTINHWIADQASSISAALAFYCAFSLAPLLVIAVAVIGWIVGAQAADAHIGAQLTALFGKSTANMIVEAMHAAQRTHGIVATLVSIGTLILGATTVFSALQSALQQIWGVRDDAPAGWRGFVRTRIVSFGFVLAIGFLLLVSLTMSTALSGLRDWVGHRYEGWVVALGALEFVVSTALATGLIALIYRYLPAVRLAWRHVLRGALVTALLFQVGRWAIGLYLGRATEPTSFGAAASFAALLLWLYYSAQIFLIGAEFTAVIGGSRVDARADARPDQRADRRDDARKNDARPRRAAN